ncbi:SAYSvFN domain-containing protein 1 [Dermochelys coriacea]|uniref:SAYSvFN domain-containing protein 1 n=1 Tax=Dermochelys coriacea TaxID=27794 RepID=UPI0018E7EA73|nr:SAYSvFN domain-containing protein 1 [Dermochelys coriacea]
MERRLAQFRAARRAPRPTAAPAREQPARPEAALGPRDRPAQEEARGPGPPRDARALLTRPALLKFLLWLALLGLAAELQFGLPCFVLSLFYWLYAGTRGPGERRPGERSAYSVFNPGCQPIQGTLTAEQLERELRYGAAAGR